MKTNVAIVIPNWNGEDYIKECLESLESQSLKPYIIVVDNGSKDGSVDIVRKSFPKVELLEYGNNAGFAGGVNRGIRVALEHGFKYIALFNNDAVADEDWLKNLINTADKDESLGIITCKFLMMDGKHIDSTGDMLSTCGMPFPRGRNEKDHGQYNKESYVFSGTGGASLYRALVFKDIGLFDEDFFAYFEDVDISFRAQLRGWKVKYQPSSVAYHHVSGTSSKMGDFSRHQSIKNFILLYNKNMPGALYWQYKLLFLYQLARIKLGSVRDSRFKVFLKAFIEALRLAPSTLKKRRKVQSSRKVDIKYIQSMLYHGRPPKPPKL